MGIEQAWLVKGWLLAKDAPGPVIGAIEAVIAGLRAGTSSLPTASLPPAFIPQFSLASPDESADGPPQPDPFPKKTKAWSPEARAAASERMRATQARLKEAKNTPPGNSPAPPPGGA